MEEPLSNLLSVAILSLHLRPDLPLPLCQKIILDVHWFTEVLATRPANLYFKFFILYPMSSIYVCCLIHGLVCGQARSHPSSLSRLENLSFRKCPSFTSIRPHREDVHNHQSFLYFETCFSVHQNEAPLSKRIPP